MSIAITLYTKEGCTLCDKVKAFLTAHADQWPHTLTEVDITQNHDTFMRYRYIIPVVTLGDERLQAPISEGELEAALTRASAASTD